MVTTDEGDSTTSDPLREHPTKLADIKNAKRTLSHKYFT
jgi:hypothetical protein